MAAGLMDRSDLSPEMSARRPFFPHRKKQSQGYKYKSITKMYNKKKKNKEKEEEEEQEDGPRCKDKGGWIASQPCMNEGI